MINRILSGIVLVLILSVNTAGAQDAPPVNEPDLSKPRLFTQLPDKIEIELDDLQQLFRLEEKTGKSIEFRFRSKNAAPFAGKIVSATTRKNQSGKSILVQPSMFNGATFSLSSSTTPDGTVRYTGRIISFKHGDAYELQEEEGRYYLIKKSFYELVNE